jgi:hypothetical protein
MPEGDTVLLAATRMHAALAGQRLVAHAISGYLHDPKRRSKGARLR